MPTKVRLILLFVILFLLSFLCIPWSTSHANMAAPSNVRIIIEHFDHPYQLDIFIYQEDVISQDQIDSALAWSYCDADSMYCYDDFYYMYPYPLSLVDFQDKDGFVSNSLYGSAHYFFGDNTRHSYLLYLNVPRHFKIVLVNDQGEKVISEIITMTTYDYTIRWDLSGVEPTSDIIYDAGIISGLQGHPLLRPATYMYAALRLVVTLIIELSLLLVFGFIKKHTFILVTIVNIITQIGLSIFVLAGFYSGRGGIFGPLIIFFFGELIIFTVEMLTHTILIKEHTKLRRISYAFVANLVSMIVGLIVMLYLLNTLFTF